VARWSSSHTPALVQAAKRRQQVTPLPQPSSAGSEFQGRPVLSTKVMPVRVWRLETGVGPPRGFFATGGRSGSAISQNASGTKGAAIASPPCFARQTDPRLGLG